MAAGEFLCGHRNLERKRSYCGPGAGTSFVVRNYGGALGKLAAE
jgi:hypothetical protein